MGAAQTVAWSKSLAGNQKDARNNTPGRVPAEATTHRKWNSGQRARCFHRIRLNLSLVEAG